MSIWQTKLQKFIEERINQEVEIYKKQNIFKDNEEAIVKKYLYDIAKVHDVNNIEPILNYLGSQVTPRDHLHNLLNQLKDDVYPLLKVPEVTPGGAPFSILRDIFCFIDYIALLRFGPVNDYGRGLGNIERLFDDFGPDDMKARYRKYKTYLVQIYRHDLVHLTSPRLKIMKVKKENEEKNEIIGFSIISDTINDNQQITKTQILNNFEQGSSLMRSSKFRENTFFHLRLYNNIPTINTISTLFDLVNYIKDYQTALGKEEELNRKFAENFIAANINSSLKLLNSPAIDLFENKRVILNE